MALADVTPADVRWMIEEGESLVELKAEIPKKEGIGPTIAIRELARWAAGSEDAFDAAVSALVMGAHVAKLETAPSLSDEVYRIEGKIWRPM